jgi:hypothetical protein
MFELIVNVLLSDSGALIFALASTIASCYLASVWSKMSIRSRFGRTE